MTRALEAAAAAVLVLLAAAWPLEALTFVPVVNWYLPMLLGGAAGLILLAHALAVGRLRLPFEIALPWLAAVGLCLWLLVEGDYEHAFRLLLVLVAFAFPVHFRPAREEHYRCLALMVISGTVASAVTVFGWIRGSMPTAYDLTTGANLHFAHDLPGGLITLLVVLTVSIGLLILRVCPWSVRIVLLAAAAVIGSVMATTLAGYAGVVWVRGAAGFFQSIAAFALGMALVYGMARVIAKVEVAREERPEPLHGVHLAVLAVVTIALLVMPAIPRLGYGFTVGLACAFALPGLARSGALNLAPLGAVPLLLVVLNINDVSPASMLDARNYERAAQADFAAGDWTQLHRRLDFIEHVSPRERRTHLWRARALLAQDRPVRAATEFGESIENPNGTLLPGPSAGERAEFLTLLRDCKSASPEPEYDIAYVRALVAEGATEEVVAYLGSVGQRQDSDHRVVAGAPLADAIGFLIQLDSARYGLDQWPPEQLLAILEAWGALVVAAPSWFDTARLPVVLVGQLRYETAQVLVTMPGDRDVQEKPITIGPEGRPALDISTWTPVFGDARKWVVEWQLGATGRGPARLTGRGMNWDLITYETTLSSHAELPAITVWSSPET